MNGTGVQRKQRKLPAEHYRSFGWWQLKMDQHEAGIAMLARQTMFKMPPNHTWALEDLVQDVKLHVWRVADRYKPELSQPSTWLWTTIRNHLANLLKSEMRVLKGHLRITDEEANERELENYTGNSSCHPCIPPEEDVEFSCPISEQAHSYVQQILGSSYMAGAVSRIDASRAASEARKALGLGKAEADRVSLEIADALVLEGSPS